MLTVVDLLVSVEEKRSKNHSRDHNLPLNDSTTICTALSQSAVMYQIDQRMKSLSEALGFFAQEGWTQIHRTVALYFKDSDDHAAKSSVLNDREAFDLASSVERTVSILLEKRILGEPYMKETFDASYAGMMKTGDIPHADESGEAFLSRVFSGLLHCED